MWSENKEAAKLKQKKPINRLTVIFDEVESHLHPQWQRVLVPSLMKVLMKLNSSLKVQFIGSTHAPLVLASVEPIFSEEYDSLTVFNIVDGKVKIEKSSWQNFGDVSSWLTSDVFGLTAARSLEAEKAIQKAFDAIDRADMDPKMIMLIHGELREVLKDSDPFWPRWLYYAEKKGVLR